MTQGIIYIISAPSGTGKSSLINSLLKTKLLRSTQISISYTTRAMRPGEVHGTHYYFVSMAEFKHMISDNFFLEYAQVFGNYYGTSHNTVELMLMAGTDIFLDIDWQGAQQVRNKISNTRSIFILPPSKRELERRLRERGQDSEGIINERMTQVLDEMIHFTEYDYLIINDDLNTTLLDLKAIIRAERLHLEYQKSRHDVLISELLAN